MAMRLRLETAHCNVDGPVTVARVQLAHRDRTGSGTASTRTSEGIWLQVVAEATLNAVRSLIDRNLDVTLDTVAEVASGRHPIVVVTMAVGHGRDEVFLSGTAPLSGNPAVAVAKAVLHGLNRWLEPFLAIAPADPSAERPDAAGPESVPRGRAH